MPFETRSTSLFFVDVVPISPCDLNRNDIWSAERGVVSLKVALMAMRDAGRSTHKVIMSAEPDEPAALGQSVKSSRDEVVVKRVQRHDYTLHLATFGPTFDTLEALVLSAWRFPTCAPMFDARAV
jgi:hypothetical protein